MMQLLYNMELFVTACLRWTDWTRAQCIFSSKCIEYFQVVRWLVLHFVFIDFFHLIVLLLTFDLI